MRGRREGDLHEIDNPSAAHKTFAPALAWSLLSLFIESRLLMTMDDDDRPRRRSQGRKKGRAKKRKADTSYVGWILGGIGGLVALFLIWSAIPVAGGGWLIKGTPLDPVVRAKVAAKREADKQLDKHVTWLAENFVKVHGNDQHAIVIVETGRADAPEFVNYLNRRINRTAGADAEEEQEQIRKNPRKHFETFKEQFDARLKPGYKPPPMRLVHFGPHVDGRAKYLVTAVPDLNKFVTQFGKVASSTIDPAKRTITLKLNLPRTITNYDALEAEDTYGKDVAIVANVTVTGADNVEKDVVLQYLSNHAARAAVPESTVDSVAAGFSYSANTMHMTTLSNGDQRYLASATAKSDGKYQLVIAPVDDINQYLPRIDFGQAELASTPRTLNIQVALPNPLPPSLYPMRQRPHPQ
jgi:hypothetical protein